MSIDLTMNVCQAALNGGAKRIVFASSNWVRAGYRFTNHILTPFLSPNPVNPYGASKLFAERYGKHLSEHNSISYICLRIGACNNDGLRLGWLASRSEWEQRMWLSDRDYCQAAEKAINVKDVKFGIFNVMSNNPGMRWDISLTRRVLGYEPKDGYTAVLSATQRIKNFIRMIQFRFWVLRVESH